MRKKRQIKRKEDISSVKNKIDKFKLQNNRSSAQAPPEAIPIVPAYYPIPYPDGFSMRSSPPFNPYMYPVHMPANYIGNYYPPTIPKEIIQSTSKEEQDKSSSEMEKRPSEKLVPQIIPSKENVEEKIDEPTQDDKGKQATTTEIETGTEKEIEEIHEPPPPLPTHPIPPFNPPTSQEDKKVELDMNPSQELHITENVQTHVEQEEINLIREEEAFVQQLIENERELVERYINHQRQEIAEEEKQIVNTVAAKEEYYETKEESQVLKEKDSNLELKEAIGANSVHSSIFFTLTLILCLLWIFIVPAYSIGAVSGHAVAFISCLIIIQMLCIGNAEKIHQNILSTTHKLSEKIIIIIALLKQFFTEARPTKDILGVQQRDQAILNREVDSFRKTTELRGVLDAFQQKRKPKEIQPGYIAKWVSARNKSYTDNLPPECYPNDQILYISTPINSVIDDPYSGSKIMAQAQVDEKFSARVQIDSGAQISVISPGLLARLQHFGQVRTMPKETLRLRGLGSTMEVNYPPVRLTVQIGHIKFEQRFIVAEALKDTDMLLGLDTLRGKHLYIQPTEEGGMALVAASHDPEKPHTKVNLEISKELNTLRINEDLTLTPGERTIVTLDIGRIGLTQQRHLESQLVMLTDHPLNEDSALQLQGDVVTKVLNNQVQVPIVYRGSQEMYYPKGWIMATGYTLEAGDLLIDKEKVIKIGSLATPCLDTKTCTVNLLQNDFTTGITITNETEPDRRIDLKESHTKPPKEPNILLESLNPKDEIRFTTELNGETFSEQMFEPKGFDYPNENLPGTELNKLLECQDIPERYRKPLVKYFQEKCPNLVAENEWSVGHCSLVEHDIEFHTEEPINQKPYKCQAIRLEQLKRAINELEKVGVLELGDSPTVSPVFFLPKKLDVGGTAQRLRLLMDFRKINANTVKQSYPLGNITDILSEIVGNKYFIAIDLKAAYHCVSLTEEASKKAAIVVPWGIYRCKKLVFGLSGAPSTFSRLMTLVMKPLQGISCHFMDDIIIYGKTEEELYQRLLVVLLRLQECGLKILPSKSQFFKPRLIWCGIYFDGNGRFIDPKRVEAIKNLGPFTSVKAVQRYMGHLAYQAAFIPHYSTVTAAISELIKQGKELFSSTPEAETARAEIDKLLVKRCMLYHPRFSEDLYLQSDASYLGAGGLAYNVSIYEDTPEDRLRAMNEWSLDTPDWISAPKSALSGTTPGTNCPANIILGTKRKAPNEDIVDHLEAVDKEEKESFSSHKENTDNSNITEDLEELESDTDNTKPVKKKKTKYVFIVRPISYWSKKFNDSQRQGWTSLEKEFAAQIQCALNYQDYINSCEGTVYVITDSQPLCFGLSGSRGANLKLVRWTMSLLNLLDRAFVIISHCRGEKLGSSDFLSRMWMVPKSHQELNLKKALHIRPHFKPGSILTVKDVIDAIDALSDIVTQIPEGSDLTNHNAPDRLLTTQTAWTCAKHTCTAPIESLKENGGTYLINRITLTVPELQNELTTDKLRVSQRKDEELLTIIKGIEKEPNKYPCYYLYQDVLYHKRNVAIETGEGQIVVPTELKPTVLALYHYRTHAGSERLKSDISTLYFWRNLTKDATTFSQSCILCIAQKPEVRTRPPLGHPLSDMTQPLREWQYDQVLGMKKVGGEGSFITCVEMYTRYCVAYSIPDGEGPTIGDRFEKYIIGPFGPPKILSCDRGSNLSSQYLRRKLGFYGISIKPGTRYSPWSHGTVEVFNRHIQCLVRILSEQYKVNWPRLLSLACLLLNTCSRPQLGNRSSYEALFGIKPEWQERHPHRLTKEETVNPETYFEIAQRQRNIARAAVKQFQEKRVQKNKAVTQKAIDMPVGSLVYLKDSSTKLQKKIHPRFYRDPRLVLREYPSVVISKDLGGKVHKDSKRNLKICHPRQAYWFSKLPARVRSALGTELDATLWEKWIQEGTIPKEFLQEDQEPEPIAVRTRSHDGEREIMTDDRDDLVLDDRERDLEGNPIESLEDQERERTLAQALRNEEEEESEDLFEYETIPPEIPVQLQSPFIDETAETSPIWDYEAEPEKEITPHLSIPTKNLPTDSSRPMTRSRTPDLDSTQPIEIPTTKQPESVLENIIPTPSTPDTTSKPKEITLANYPTKKVRINIEQTPQGILKRLLPKLNSTQGKHGERLNSQTPTEGTLDSVKNFLTRKKDQLGTALTQTMKKRPISIDTDKQTPHHFQTRYPTQKPPTGSILMDTRRQPYTTLPTPILANTTPDKRVTRSKKVNFQEGS